MLNRRQLLITSSIATATAIATREAMAALGETPEVIIDSTKLTAEQKELLSIRLPTLDGESDEDFVVGMKKMIGAVPARSEITARMAAFLKSKGLSMLDDTEMSYEQSFNLLMQHPDYAAQVRMGATIQHLMWDRAQRIFHRRADRYLDLMEKSDTSGPGHVELNPNMFIPDSCRHEVHTQPGGYVGDPLGGWVYHYAVTQGFRVGEAYHDENHIDYAMGHQKPADGQVRRLLDIGCGTGQSTTVLKMRFPNSEVWGIDVGGPLVRYAHHRAAKLNFDVNFRQALAEDTKFPDQYFDWVSDTILFHEVAGNTLPKIAAEIFRILRPGGTFSHSDIPSGGYPRAPISQTIMAKASSWSSHRVNDEPWWIEFTESDFPGVLRKAGFKVDASLDPIHGRSRIVATKPV